MAYDLEYFKTNEDDVVTEGRYFRKAVSVIKDYFTKELGLDATVTPTKSGKDEVMVIDLYAKKVLIGTTRVRLPWYRMQASLGATDMPAMSSVMMNMIKKLKNEVGSNLAFAEDVVLDEVYDIDA